MKIGILTFWNSEDNYGQILQCYALQQFLHGKGHEAFLIKYAYRRPSVSKLRWIDLRFLLKNYLSLLDIENLKLFLLFRKMFKKPAVPLPSRHFSEFKNKYIVSLEAAYDQHDLYDNPPEADVYITGSDQVWKNTDPGFFLDFVPDGKRRIAYAPSFGNDRLPRLWRSETKRYLKRFDVLTVRERSGLSICASLGFNAVQVPDPTYLLDGFQYEAIMPELPNTHRQPYLFLYLLGNKADFDLDSVYRWAEARHLEVKYVASQGAATRPDALYPNVDEWLSLIHHAEYVVTNSFHGMTFCIILNKRFTVIPLNGVFSRMNDRIYTVIDQLGLADRIYQGDLELLSASIDYAMINRKLSEQRKYIDRLFDQWLG